MASLLSWLGKRAKAVEAQLNPFDGGKTYNTVVNNQQLVQRPQVQQPQIQRPVSYAPQPLQQRVNQSYGSGISSITNRFRDLLDANTEADKIKRFAQSGLNETYNQQQDRLNQQSLNSPVHRSGVNQAVGNFLGGAAEITKLPAQMGNLASAVQQSHNPLIRGVVTAVNPSLGISSWLPKNKNQQKNIEAGQRMSQQAEQLISNKIQQSGLGERSTDNSWIAKPTRVGGQIGSQLAAAAATGGGSTVGAMIPTVQVASGSYDAARNSGFNNDKALGVAGLQGVLTGVTSKVGLGNIAGEFGAGRNILTNALQKTLIGGADMGAQQFASNVINKLTYNPNQNLMDGVKQAAVTGGIVSGIASPIGYTRVNPEQAVSALEQAKNALTLTTPASIELRSKYKQMQKMFDTASPSQRRVLNRQMAEIQGKIRSIEQGGYVQVPGGKDVDPLESLKQEARKYKSAEEFVDKIGKALPEGDAETARIQTIRALENEVANDKTRGWADAATDLFNESTSLNKVVGGVDTGKVFYHGTGEKTGRNLTVEFPKSKDGGDIKILDTDDGQLMTIPYDTAVKMYGTTDQKTLANKIVNGNQATQSQPPKSTPTKPKVTEAEVVANQNNRHFEGSSADRPLPDYKAGDKVSTYTMYGEVSGVLKKVPDYNKSHLIKGNDFVVKLDKPLELPNERGTLKEIVTDGRDFKTIKKATPESSVVANPNSITEKPSTPKVEAPTGAPIEKTPSVQKFGWNTEETPQGTKLFNRNGKHVATITEKKGRYTASYTDGTRIATGSDANKLAEDVARKTFYAQELPQSKNQGGTLRPDKAPEPYKNTAIQSELSPERASVVQASSDKMKSALEFDKTPTPKKAYHSTGSLEIEGGKLRASGADSAMGEGVYLHTNPETAKYAGAMQSDGNIADQTALDVNLKTDNLFKWADQEYPTPKQVALIKNRGYDGIYKKGGEIVVFDPNKVEIEQAGVKPKGLIVSEARTPGGQVTQRIRTKGGKVVEHVVPSTKKFPTLQEFDKKTGGKGGLKATRQTEDVINPDAPDFLQVNKNDVPVTPSTSKYSAPKLPIDNPQSRLRPQSDMTAVPLENTGVTRFNEAAPRQIKGRVKKDAVVKSVLGEISKSKGKGNVEASIIAADLTTKAKRLGVKLDRKFIDKYQAGALDTPAEKQMGAAIKQVTDELFRKQQALDPTIQYRKNYIPQSYAQDAATVEEATKRLAKTTGAANRRTFNTYKEAESFGLTPRDKNLEQMLGHAASKVEQVAQNRKVVQKGMEGGIFTTNQSGGTPLMGVFAPDGSQLYAKKQVADVINGVLQKDSTGLAKAISKTAHAFGVAQDVMLQGGVPGTNANFFVAGQMVKDTTRNIGKAPLHPIQATKQEGHLLGDFFRGNKGTQKRFAEGTFKAGGKQIKNSDFVRQMADRGLYIQPQTKLTGEGKNIVARGWNKLGNNPTFGRYMPNRMLSTAQEVYAQSVKKLGHDKALDLAAETTKTFTGHVDTILKGRSGLTEDVAGIFLFAPKYRESILGALGNVVKSTYPTNWSNPKFKPSRQLLAGMAVTLGAYELMNRELTGHSMMQNRPGQELSVEIPYGEKDDKGNQKVLNIPFMPGFMTIPRAAFSAANALRKGDAKGVIAEAGKALSAPMQDATAIIGNRDYFGNPIYIDKATAEKEGVSPDSAFTASKKIGGYLFGQLSPSWVRGGQQLAAGKPKEQAIATALEAPLKFGKRLNPDTVAYFDRRDKFTATLNKNEKAMFDKINPSKKNIRGEDIKDEGTLVKASNYADLIAHPEFADKYQAYQKSAPSHDPLWDLNKNQLRSYMQAQVISKNNPGGDGNTVRQLYDRLPKDFFATREKYFADLKKKGVKFDSKNKPNPGMPDKLVAFSEAYHKLPYGTGARKAALNSQTGKEYIAWLEQNKIRNNQERADLGLPPLEDKGSSYGGYSKGGGGGGRKGGGGGGRKGSGTAKLASVLKASNAAIKPPAKPKSPGIKVKTSNVPTTFKKAPLKKYAVAKVTVGKSRR